MEFIYFIILIIIFNVLRNLYVQSQEKARRQQQGGVRSGPQRRTYHPEQPIDIIIREEADKIDPAQGQSSSQTLPQVDNRFHKPKLQPTEKPEFVSMEDKVRMRTSDEKVMPSQKKNYYLKLLSNPASLRDAIVVAEILKRPKFR